MTINFFVARNISWKVLALFGFILTLIIFRNVALVILLIRAGLDLDPQALRRLKYTVIKVGLVPWTVEALIIAVLSVFLLGIPWDYGILLGNFKFYFV